MSLALPTMDFFERQDRARRNTKWLVLYFVAAVACIILGIYLVFAGIFLRDQFTRFGPEGFWHPQLFLGVTTGTCLVVLFGSLYKLAELRRGGVAVAEMLGGRRIAPNTDDPNERKVLNVVEEMALASGMAVPPVYLLLDEDGINAFAAGHSSNDAVIGVTRGCVKLLSRDELQGVIAHEFSHILNGDMRLNLRLMGVIFGILCLAVIGRVLLQSGTRRHYRLGARNDGKGGNPLPLIGLALIIISSIGVFFGRLIQAAVSRQREFLADAAAVQFTRNPDGLAGALKKIGGLAHGSRLVTAHATEASHLFFGNAVRAGFTGLMATHPPLEQRIRAIDPHFDGKFPALTRAAQADDEPLAHSSFAAATSAPRIAPRPDFTPPPLPVGASLRRVGSPEPAHLEAATAWRESLPEPLLHTLHDPVLAPTVMYALVLNREDAGRAKQLSLIQDAFGDEVTSLTRERYADISAMTVLARLPLAELCVSALRELSPESYVHFRTLLRQLIESDRQIDLFEYALEKCLDRHLAPTFETTPRAVVQYYSITPLMEDIVRVLSLLARVGHADETTAVSAYMQAIASLGATGASWPMLPAAHSGLAQADEALGKLAQAVPIIKKQFLHAAALAVASDGQLAAREAEMLRAIADAVDCPIPPFVELHRSVG